MKIKFIKYSIVFLLLMLCSSTYTQFAPKDEFEIRKKAQKLLSEYEEKLNQIGEDVKSIDQTRVNIEAFIRLFVDRKTQIYNDLDPSHTLSEYYEAETYTSNIALWYPAGITVSLDFKEAQFSNIISHGEGVYSIDFIVDKKINGMYLGKTLNTNTENLQFRIGFTGIGQKYQNFKIAGIRKPSKTETEQPDTKILEVRSASIPSEDRRDIDRETRTLLNDYTNYLSLIGDTIEDIEEKILYKESFRTLFSSNQSPVYNDILPEGMKNTFIPVSDYINMYSEAYSSEGGKVTFDTDSADLGFIAKRNDSTFSRNVQVNKYFEGNYLGKRYVKFKIRLKLLVVFYYKNHVYKEFKINKIDQTVEKKAEAVEKRTFSDLHKRKKVLGPDQQFTSKPEDEITNRVRISAGASVGIGLINDKNLSSLTIADNALEWKIEPQLCYAGFANYTFKISPKIGLVTGAGYSALSTKYSINSKIGTDTAFTDSSSTYKDVNGKLYVKKIKAKLDSTVTINYINIPVGVVLEFNPNKNIHLVVKPGINIGIVSKAISKTSGSIYYYGYYSWEKFTVFQTKDWADFGFYSKDKLDNENNIKSSFNTVTINASLSLGLWFNLSKKLALCLSGEAQYGLTNIVKNNGTYKDLFGQTETKYELEKKHVFDFKPVNIFTYGIALEFIVKL